MSQSEHQYHFLGIRPTSQGFTLVEVMIGAAVGSILMLAGASVSTMLTASSNQTQIQNTGSLIRASLTSILMNSNAWAYTVFDSANTTFSCFSTDGPCDPGPLRPFEIRDTFNNVYYNPLGSAKNGFTSTGAACTGFDAVNGNNSCPFGVTVTWTPICVQGCSNMEFNVSGSVIYKPAASASGIAGKSWNFAITKYWQYADPYTWTGAAGDSDWNTPLNWFGRSVPGAANVAIFDPRICKGMCSTNINNSTNVSGVSIRRSYLGSITQKPGITVSIGTSGWNQAGGYFVGSDSPITLQGASSLTGGAFTSTSNDLVLNSDWTVKAPGAFVANGGNLRIKPPLYSPAVSLTTANETYNDVTVDAGGDYDEVDLTGTMRVGGKLYGTSQKMLRFNQGPGPGGQILAFGDVVLSNTGFNAYGGNIWVIMAGTGTQTITGSLNAILGNLNIASQGNVNLVGTIELAGSYTFTSGALNAGTSNLRFTTWYECGPPVITTPGTETYHDVTFNNLADFNQFTINGNFQVGGTLYGASPHIMALNQGAGGGAIVALGDVVLSNTGMSGYMGDAYVKLAGNGTQTLTGVDGAGVANLAIASTGTVNFVGTIDVLWNYAFNSGTLKAGTSTLVFQYPSMIWGNTAQITAGNEIYNNVTFNSSATYLNSVVNGTLNVGGTLTGSNPNIMALNQGAGGGAIVALGDVVLSNTGISSYMGNAYVKLAGTGTQTLTGVDGAGVANLAIASTGTVNLVGTIDVLWNYTFTSGTLNAGTSTLVFQYPGMIWGNTAQITAGNAIYNNVTFNSSATYLHSVVNGTLNVGGTLTASNPNIMALDGGTVVALGDVVLSNNGLAGYGGTGTLLLGKNGAQAINGSGTLSNLLVGSSSQVTLGGNVTVQGSSNLQSPLVKMSGNSLSIGGTLTLGSGTDLMTGGGSLSYGALANNGGVIN